MAKKLLVKQIKSSIGTLPKQKATLRALGLRKIMPSAFMMIIRRTGHDRQGEPSGKRERNRIGIERYVMEGIYLLKKPESIKKKKKSRTRQQAVTEASREGT